MPPDPAFTEDQKQYLEGFIAALARNRGMTLPNGAATATQPAAEAAPSPRASAPSAIHIAAQDRPDVEPFWEAPGRGVRCHLVPDVERVLLALC
jgi:hypothetical protein